MSGHTPTPWRHANTIYVGDNGCPAVVDHLDLVICDMIDDGRSEDECRANAAFIIKAVNGHEALVEALTDLIEAVRRDSDEGGKGISGYTAARLSEAREALANADAPVTRPVAGGREP